LAEIDNNPGEPSNAVARAILDAIAKIPATTEHPVADPRQRASSLIGAAALKTATVSGALALPAGPMALATIIPDLYAVWRIQAQLVADIAGLFGKSALLTQKQMLYCLFRHAAAQAIRDLVTRVGERVIFRQSSLRVLQSIARKLGIKVTRRLLANSLARFVPVVGAGGVAAYAAWDTHRVGKTAIALFAGGFESEGETAP
jgi:hypothetical protein